MIASAFLELKQSASRLLEKGMTSLREKACFLRA